MQRVDVQHEFPQGPARVFAYLAEHDHLGPVLGAHIHRLSPAPDGSPNGVGSVRGVKIGPLPSFEETVTEVVPDHLIRYRITRGTPLDHHLGTLTFDPAPGGGTRFSWVVELDAKVPGVAALVRVMITRAVRRGMEIVEARA